jgi:hypothetical protein
MILRTGGRAFVVTRVAGASHLPSSSPPAYQLPPKILGKEIRWRAETVNLSSTTRKVVARQWRAGLLPALDRRACDLDAESQYRVASST